MKKKVIKSGAKQHGKFKGITDANRLFNCGNLDLAEKIVDQILLKTPGVGDALLLKAAIKYRQKKFAEAELLCQRASNLGVSTHEFDNILGLVLKSTDRKDEAKRHYENALSRCPSSSDLHHNYANLLFNLKDTVKAAEHQKKAIELRPNHVETLRQAGKIAVNNRDHAWAMECFQTLLQLNPNSAEALNGIGAAYLLANDHTNARIYFEKCLSVDPKTSPALANLGILLKSNDEIERAEECFNRALELEPDNVEHRWNLSLLLLAKGNYKKGWSFYEDRYAESRTAPDRVILPKLQGVTHLQPTDVVRGKVVAVLHEQGLGDTLQFTRFAENLYKEGATVLLMVPEELIEVMQTLPWAAYVTNKLSGFSRLDYFVLTASLCRRYMTEESDIPRNIPYLYSNSTRQTKWNEHIPRSEKLNVALVWAGKPTHGNDMNRSLSLASFNGLANHADRCNFYSIQMGDRSNDPVPDGLSITKLHSQISNFADSAAILQRMDLLITIDSSPAHLAGALGVPVWVLVPKVSDFRWLKGRTESPWYPTMRLFRQTEIGNWQPTLDELSKELGQVHKRIDTPMVLEYNDRTELPQNSGIGFQSEAAVLLHKSGNDQRAYELYRWILQVEPNQVDVLRNLGVLYRKHGKFELAESCYEKAMQLSPHDKNLLLNYANLKLHQEKFDQAQALAERAAAIDPNVAGVHYILAKTAQHHNQIDLAFAHIRRALVIDSGNKDFAIFLAYLYIKEGMLQDAARMLPQLISIGKTRHDANSLVAQYYTRVNEHEKAVEFFTLSLAANPNNKLDLLSRGNEHAALQLMDKAVEDFKQATILDPEYAEAHQNLAMAYLLQGDFERGLPEYEWRVNKKRIDTQRLDFPSFDGVARWEGQPLQDRSILVYPEQGFGDAIQFIRYAKNLKEMGATVYVACKNPLKRLFETYKWIDHLLVEGSAMPKVDYWVPIMSLPFLCKTTLATIPNEIPYFDIASQAAENNLREIGCGPMLGKQNLVLVWSGSKSHTNDAKRSIPKECLAPILELAEYNIVAFDFENKEKHVEIGGRFIENIAYYTKDFYDLALFFKCSAHVVSVDSSPVHLSGALGVQTSALLAYLPDFRWMLGRQDTPWYPSVRLYRQVTRGDWSKPIESLTLSLASNDKNR